MDAAIKRTRSICLALTWPVADTALAIAKALRSAPSHSRKVRPGLAAAFVAVNEGTATLEKVITAVVMFFPFKPKRFGDFNIGLPTAPFQLQFMLSGITKTNKNDARPRCRESAFLSVFVIPDYMNCNWKGAVGKPILEASKRFGLKGKNMTTAVVTFSNVAFPSFTATKAAAKPGLTLREWLGALRSALAMASTVSATGQVSARQMDRVRLMAASI
jgi:hypothetical protein